jgi:site-specific DNA recombinase
MTTRLRSVTTIGIYARISDDRAGSGLGVARQEEDCRRLADTRGWTVGDVYVDNDISAYGRKHRPSYERMLGDLAARRIEGVVAWHPDRLQRRPVELETFIDLIETTGAVVATVQAGDLDLATASGRMTARIVGAVARHESEHKSERHRRKALELALAGKRSGGGMRPFGFEDDWITVRESEAEVVREMATRIAADESLRGVVADINRRGILSPAGKPLSPFTVRRMLLSGRIAGLREHHGEMVADSEWPALVDRPTWEAVRRIMLDPGRRRNHHPRSYLLTGGVAYCGVAPCTARLVARPRSDGRRCYVCATGPGNAGCGKIRALADPLEEWVVESMLHRLDDGGLARVLAERSEVEPTSAAELVEVERRLDEAAEMYANGLIGRRDWLTSRARLETRREGLVAGLATQGSTSALANLVGPGGHREQWKRLSFDQRRAALVKVVDRVVVGPAVRGLNRFDPARVGIEWRV